MRLTDSSNAIKQNQVYDGEQSESTMLGSTEVVTYYGYIYTVTYYGILWYYIHKFNDSVSMHIVM